MPDPNDLDPPPLSVEALDALSALAAGSVETVWIETSMFVALLAEVRAGRERLEAADAVLEDEEAAHLETLGLLKQRTEERDMARRERDVFSSDNLRAERDSALRERDAAREALEKIAAFGSPEGRQRFVARGAHALADVVNVARTALRSITGERGKGE